jgi:hypothetical protein
LVTDAGGCFPHAPGYRYLTGDAAVAAADAVEAARAAYLHDLTTAWMKGNPMRDDRVASYVAQKRSPAQFDRGASL